jgi:drug/metabolite transporter (DMT)-like permease
MPTSVSAVSDNFGSLLGLAAPLSMALLLIVFALLSKRLGEITRHPRYYRWYFVGAVVIVMAVLLRITLTGWRSAESDQIALLYNLLLVIGLIIGVVTTWQYWGWLLGDRGVERERSKRNSTYASSER